MKKFVCLLLVLALCLSVTLAETIPSKTTSDLTEVKDVVVENLPADAGFTVTVAEDEVVVTIANTEVAKLVKAAATDDVTTYFGEIVDVQGNAVSLTEVLGTETVNVFELLPIEVKEYEESYGNAKVTMSFSTPYTRDEQVIVMLGLVTVNKDGTQIVAWTAYQAQVVEEGSIQVEFDPKTLRSIQEGTALIAILSK